MIRTFAIGTGIICLLAVGLVIANADQSTEVAVRETAIPDSGCVTREVALDPGYGISRKISQQICAGQD